MEAADTQEIRTQLTSSHDGFRQLVQQHHTLSTTVCKNSPSNPICQKPNSSKRSTSRSASWR